MKWALWALCGLLLLGAAEAQSSVTIRAKMGPIQAGGGAEFPAYWIHPTTENHSLMILSDKHGGLFVYDFKGKLLQHVDAGQTQSGGGADSLISVDVRKGLELTDEDTIDIVAANLQFKGKLLVMKIDPRGAASPTPPLTMLANGVSTGNSISSGTYGMTLYKSRINNKVYAFDVSEGGNVKQWLITGSTGAVSLSLVRTLQPSLQPAQGLVADDGLGFVYVAEEARGINKYQAEPGTSTSPVYFFGSGDGSASDRKGLALYSCNDGSGYVIMVSQGNDQYKVYERQGNNAFVKTFMTQETSNTDGITVSSAIVPGFPKGFAIIQDTPGAVYYVYDWADIAGSNLKVCPNGGGPPSLPCTPGNPCQVANASMCSGRFNAQCACVDDIADACPGGGPSCVDADRDGYGNPPANCQNSQADCNDNNPAIKPGATEVCGNNVDDNCNARVDEGCAGCTPGTACTVSNGSGCAGRYTAACTCVDDVADSCPGAAGSCRDQDRDGYGSPSAGCANAQADCNDGNSNIRPGAAELCTNGLDDNCNTLIDSADPACTQACATDGDRDGFKGDAGCPGSVRDCNDNNYNVNPGQNEACCNAVDDDCDSYVDENCPPCNTPTACAGGVPVNTCNSQGQYCMPDGTLYFNCVLCPICAPGYSCTQQGCAPSSTCSPACVAGQDCVNGACIAACTPVWSCENWPDVCPESGTKTRLCYSNNCQVGQKTETQPCEFIRSVCNNGALEQGEVCDGAALRQTECAALPGSIRYDGGALSCRSDCTYDVSQCCVNERTSSMMRMRPPPRECGAAMAPPPASTSVPSNDQSPPKPPPSTTNQDSTTSTINPPPENQSPQSSRTPGRSIPSRASDNQPPVATEETRLAFLGSDPLITALLILMGAALLIILMRARSKNKAQDVYR